MTVKSWNATRLWLELRHRDEKTEKIRSVLQAYMPNISDVLHDSGIGLEDFTLHDEGHAFRVAERMVDIMPRDLLPKLTDIEIALLIFSAYLHDIGMSPGASRILLLRNYLLTNQWTTTDSAINKYPLFPSGEQQLFDHWLLENLHERPISTTKFTPTKVLQVNQQVAHYCRSRHNDWSEFWIRTNMNNTPCLYKGWIEDLIVLCRSHHEGYNRLSQNTFNPRPVPGSNSFVHLRYLACVLRVADVIEFDPERTPEVILRHRNVSSESRIFWWKDQDIAWIISDEGRLTISARPPSAAIHRAIENTVQDVERELKTCLQLAQNRSFSEYGGSMILPHRWQLGVAVHQDIQPRDGAYIFIDGTFRPNTDKLLKLLGGLELYRHNFAAIRELLQNAFDAVREQIARQQLLHPQGSNQNILSALQKMHFVRLRLDKIDSGLCLTCTDSGSGMSKEILEKYFLISGESRRPDVSHLEKLCAEKGIYFTRSGQFGIGALSYFLLAQRVQIKSRRSAEAGDADSTGWAFETDGIESFGELRPNKDWKQGTEVCFFLIDTEADSAPSDISQRIAKYTRECLRHIPCQFHFESLIEPADSYTTGPGWTLSDYDLTTFLLDNTKLRSLGEKNSPWRDSLLDDFYQPPEWILERQKSIVNDLNQRLRWFSREEELPEGLGSARIHIPWFYYENGGCLAYFNPSNKSPSYNSIINSVFFHSILPPASKLTSWRGMSIRIGDNSPFILHTESTGDHAHYDIGILEVDLRATKAVLISPNRQTCHLTDEGIKALAWCKDSLFHRTISELDSFLHRDHTEWKFVNKKIIGYNHDTLGKEDFRWITEINRPDGTFLIRPVSMPATNASFFDFQDKRPTTKGRKKQPVQVLPELSAMRDSDGRSSRFNAINYEEFRHLGVKIAWRVTRRRITPIPIAQKSSKKIPAGILTTAEFPNNWSNLAGAKAGTSTFWNQENRVALGVSEDSLAWAKENADPRPVMDELLGDYSKACAWIIDNIENEFRWMALNALKPGVIASLLALIYPERKMSRSLLFFAGDILLSPSKFVLLSKNGVQTYEWEDVRGNLLPDLDDDWLW